MASEQSKAKESVQAYNAKRTLPGAAAGTSMQAGQTPGSEGAYGGVTNYADISKKFQSWQPTSDWGKSLQATYMMNTLQSFNDMQQAESMAFTNAGIQMDMMTAQAGLELANKGACGCRTKGSTQYDGCAV